MADRCNRHVLHRLGLPRKTFRCLRICLVDDLPLEGARVRLGLLQVPELRTSNDWSTVHVAVPRLVQLYLDGGLVHLDDVGRRARHRDREEAVALAVLEPLGPAHAHPEEL